MGIEMMSCGGFLCRKGRFYLLVWRINAIFATASESLPMRRHVSFVSFKKQARI